ncbi:MAG: hypothetical protein WBM81_00495 [Sedimenticolaceae bacterium]
MKLTGKHIRAAAIIASGESKQHAAHEIGVTPQTISEWCADSDFEAALNRFKWDILDEARDRMRGLSGVAVNTLAKLLSDDTKDAIRLQAIRVVLQHIGFTDPQTGLWTWGSTDPKLIGAEKIAKTRKEKEAALLQKFPAEYNEYIVSRNVLDVEQLDDLLNRLLEDDAV